ncbi:MAG TPA: sulfur carrier protein ThiS adenylyltransferase ThiF [Lachnospiraceae bacterium]|nr:sulfur carrier protein ThiS adenylyltransferase ThiF [Lachnospiraceae bacterium]
MVSEKEIDDALALRHTRQVQEKLKKAKAAVCGLGGLGSHIAGALARCGVGSLHLIDDDRVDLSNLNRQQYTLAQLGMPKPEALKEWLLSFNPYLKICTDCVRMTEENTGELLKDDPYICEAFDQPETKAMLTNYVLEHFPERYLVGASGMAGFGESNRIHTRRITSHYYLCGDEISGIETCGSLMAPRVMLCAAHQANKMIELILQGGRES